jgi:di/tricarboxylate transporter
MWTTFTILIVTLVLFAWGRMRADLVALTALSSLFITSQLNAQETLSGFGNSTVILIAVLFVVSEGLARTGITAWVGKQMLKLAGNKSWRLLLVVMLASAFLSAFVSNTGTVAALMPAVIAISWSTGSNPSKYLLPLAFAANAGGLLTLMGTPPNIIVAEASLTGIDYRIGFFEYALVGLPLLVITILYSVFFGHRLLPSRKGGEKPEDLKTSMQNFSNAFELEGDLFRLLVTPQSSLCKKTLAEAGLGRDFQITILSIESHQDRHLMLLHRQEEELTRLPEASSMLSANDSLLVKGSPELVKLAAEVYHMEIEPPEVSQSKLGKMLLSQDVGIAEVLIAPRSSYTGQTLQEGQFAQKYGVQVVSIRRNDQVLSPQDTRLQVGDALLVRGRWEDIELLRNEVRNFLVVGHPDDLSKQIIEINRRSVISVLALLGMVVLMVGGWITTTMSALLAAVVMLVGGCLTTEQAYRAVNWSSVVLIACMIPAGIALENSGGATYLAGGLVNSLGQISPLALMAGIFVLTAGFSQIVSNTATAVLMIPIVFQSASALEISPIPLMITVAVAASTAFMTPIASTTNLMVMSPGSYRFGDYARYGFPLVVVYLIGSLLLIPLIWPW